MLYSYMTGRESGHEPHGLDHFSRTHDDVIKWKHFHGCLTLFLREKVRNDFWDGF